MKNFESTHSETINMFVIKWYISAESEVDKNDGEEYLNFKIFLDATFLIESH